MNEFVHDDEWQKDIRDRILKPWYQKHSFEGRFVFADKGKLATKIQREMAIDTIAQIPNGFIRGVEEKIVRWPANGRPYQNFTFETMSCTVPGHEKQGWMYYSNCDTLLYCFVQEDGNSIIAYSIPFDNLKKWFFENDRYTGYPTTVTKQINKTECRIVPISDVVRGVPGCKRIVIQPELEEA